MSNKMKVIIQAKVFTNWLGDEFFESDDAELTFVDSGGKWVSFHIGENTHEIYKVEKKALARLLEFLAEDGGTS